MNCSALGAGMMLVRAGGQKSPSYIHFSLSFQDETISTYFLAWDAPQCKQFRKRNKNIRVETKIRRAKRKRKEKE
jgi:hypothetical protein